MSAQDNEYKASGALKGAWKIAAGVGVLGLGGALAMGASDPKRFAYSYLFAFATFLSLAVGMTFFVLFQHVTSAWWSVTVRRTAEFFMSALPIFALLFVPVAMHADDLYGEWMNHGAQAVVGHESGEHGRAPNVTHAGHAEPGEQGEGHGEGRGPATSGHRLSQEEIEHHTHAEVMASKDWYLNTGFFYLRALIYFAAWTLISYSLFRNSTKQDAAKGEKEWTRRSQAMAPWAIPVMALTTTFAAFDWYMSLLPSWYSTMFGVWHFAACLVVMFATLTMATIWLRTQKLVGDTINVEHFHDLGKLLFGFNCFWAYISFCQFFLIWYAAIPEETVFYHLRWAEGPWTNVTWAIVFLHFVLPFVLLMSRDVKRNLSGLMSGAALLLVMHIVEMYWIIMPNYARAMGIDAHEAAALSVSVLDLLSFLGVGGAYMAVVLYRMANHSLVAVGDPRFDRSLHFENA